MSIPQMAPVVQQSTEVHLDYPQVESRQLRITAGACRLHLSPGSGPEWVTGTYSDPSDVAPLHVVTEGDTTRLIVGESPAAVFGMVSGPPRLDLQLGAERPYALVIQIGAGDVRLALGALPITRLEIKPGAGKVEMDFASPNPQTMSLLTFGGGAGSFEATHLANANCSEMIFEGGAAAFTLGFGGVLRRDTHVRVATGVSSVEIRVPATTPARVTSESLLCYTELTEGWTRQEGAFWNESGRSGAGALLRITASVALGSLQLRTA